MLRTILPARIIYSTLLSLTLFTPLTSSADVIRIGGTGSALATMQQLGKTFSQSHPEHSIKVLPSLGSGGGIKALQGKALDIAVISRELKPEEAASGLVATEYGITPFVFAVHRNVPVDNISLNDIAAIYSGQKLKWDNGELIRPVLRPAGDTDTVLLLGISPEIEKAVLQALQRQGMVFAITDIDGADSLERLPGSFGTTALALILAENRQIKPLSIDGVAPNIANLKNGTYRYWKPFNMVTDKSTSLAAQQFIAFVKSAEGQKLLKQFGHHVTR
jgi:phosphate transport system substrate-binding protein